MDIFIELNPQKDLFRGVRDLILVPSKGKPALAETPGHLGGRLRTHAGHGTSEFVAVNMLGCARCGDEVLCRAENAVFGHVQMSECERA